MIQILCIFSAYMHQKRREWEKKQKKFKNVANFNVPVLFASSEGLYLRLIDDEFGPGTEQNNDIENTVSQISIQFFPNCSGFFPWAKYLSESFSEH